MRKENNVKSMAMLKEILAPMTWKERLEYLWEYYKLVAIFAVVVIAFVISIISTCLQPDVIYEGVGVNLDLPNYDTTYVVEDWLAVMGVDPKKETAKYSSIFVGDLDEEIVDTELAVGAQKVMLMVIAESLDYVLMDDQAVEFYLEKEIFGSLETMLSQEQLEQYAEKMIYTKVENQEIPVVLDISDTALAKACGVYGKGLYIAFPGNTGRTEWNDDFLEHLLKWEAAE